MLLKRFGNILDYINRENVLETVDIVNGDLRIRTFTEDLINDAYVSWLNDPLVVRYSEQRHHVHTLESCKNYFDTFLNSQNMFLAIFFQCDDEIHVGNITVYVDVYNNRADLSIMIGNRKFWNKSFGLRAWQAILDYLLHTKNFRMVTAGTMSLNYPMLKVFEKSGMQIDSKRPNFMLLDSNQVDLVYASKVRDFNE